MIITLVIDNPNSWFVPYGKELQRLLQERGHTVSTVQEPTDLPMGDVAFFLSCEQIVKKDLRDRNKNNIVIHGSALPQGKGWSPLTWRILEGHDSVTLSLFEAQDAIDAGDIYLQKTVSFAGTELIDELRKIEGDAIVDIAVQYIIDYPLEGKKQVGQESFYPRRTAKDSELDPCKTIAEQFNLLRVADNARYPAFFTLQGRRYTITIEGELPESFGDIYA
jgi:methionyl-tRNA formyltransferase